MKQSFRILVRGGVRLLPALLVSLVFGASVSVGSAADTYPARRSVSLVTLDDYAPFCFPKNGRSNQGREVIAPGADSDYLQGYSWEVVRDAFHSQGFFIVLDAMAWNSAEASARMADASSMVSDTPAPERSSISVNFKVSGVSLYSNAESTARTQGGRSADLLFPAVKSADRAEVFAFSSRPVDQMAAVLYLPVNSRIAYQGLSSLDGRRVGVVKGWSYGALFDDAAGINKLDLDDTETGFRLLRQGRIEALAGYDAVFDRQLRKIGWAAHFKKNATGNVLREYVCGVRGASRTTSLLEVFDNGLRTIAGNGRLDAIARKWQVEPIAVSAAR